MQIFGYSSHHAPVQTLPWSSFGILKRPAGFTMDFHNHDFLQIIHVLGGSLRIDWEEGWRELRADQVHILPPGFRHRLSSPHGYTQFGLNCTSAKDERGLLEMLLMVFAVPTVMAALFPDTRLRHDKLDRQPEYRPTNHRTLNALDAYAVALVESRRGISVGQHPQQLLDFLRKHPAQRLRVEDVARHLHMSRATLQRICRQHFHCGVAHLHERLRMEEAARQLLCTDLNISACAAVCGYEDIYHFSRAFKRVFRVSPKKYREERRRELA